MEPRHFRHWPPDMPRSLAAPQLRLHDLLAAAAQRDPGKAATVFQGESLSYGELLRAAENVAGHLQRACGVRPGDRVLLDLQNGPAFVTAFFGVLRADAVAVPVSPMNLAGELRHYVDDSDAKVAIADAEVAERLAGLPLQHLILADGLARLEGTPAPSRTGMNDLCVMPYTSGSTGRPKGCMHTHATVMHNVVGSGVWKHVTEDTVALATAPFFHVTGLIHSFLATVWAGGTIVIQRRWDPLAAAELVERHRCTHWDNVPTMVVDLLSHPQALAHDVSSLKWIFGGGAAMPEAIAQKLFEICGVRHEGRRHDGDDFRRINPPQSKKRGSASRRSHRVAGGGSEASVLDPAAGEIVVRVHSPPGLPANEPAYRESTGRDRGPVVLPHGRSRLHDEDGYFFLVDRLKRMINAAGFKVWPAEVEAAMYRHPAIQECCIIAAPDARRGETVKAVVVLKPGAAASGAEILEWAHGQMAAYKAPRLIEFSAALPRTPSGKIQWRALQEKEFARQ
jgi:fatty-acyl-CoA synthase